ncbi:MAG: MFS transporter [Actinobacteria bacterium]|nr:MAG: MFS transporter [Actinomycetota bacterium]
MVGERFGPLSERPFRLLWLGRTGSAFGDALIPVALAFAVLRIGGGATGLGLVLASYTVGRASFVALGGVWADRLPRRAVMIGADLVRFSTQAATAALLFGHVLHVWELAVLQGIAGAGGGFFVPASTAFVPQAVTRARLQQANALLSLSQSATNIFGPAVSGAIVAAAGPAWVFAIDAGSFLFSTAFLTALRGVEAHVRPSAQRFWHDLGDGWREVRRHRWLTAGFLGFALGNVGIGIFLVLGPLVARQHLGGAQAWGLILTAGAIGGVLGGLVGYRIRPRRPVAAAFAVWAWGAALPLALVPPLPLALIMAASGVLTLTIIFGNTLWETALQQEVRPDRLARVGSIDWLLSLCLMPVGQALAGPLSGPLGVRGTLLLAAALMCVPNLSVLAFVREVRHVRRPELAEATVSS